MTQLRDLMAKLQQLEEAAPTTFTPTHFHKNNLGGMIPLMLNQADGKFYWQTTTSANNMSGQTSPTIEPWNFGMADPESRSAMNPASIDGVYQNGKPVEFPPGVTWKSYNPTPTSTTSTASAPVNQSGKAADPVKDKMVARFKELLTKAGVMPTTAAQDSIAKSIQFDPKADLNPAGAPAIRLKANEGIKFKSLIGKALTLENLNEELTKDEYKELSKLFGELSVTYKDDPSLAPLFTAYDKVKPVWNTPAATDADSSAKPSASNKKLLPKDPKVQAFQDELTKLNPKALPRYGADGRLGSETQAEIDKNPELAKKHGLTPSTTAPKATEPVAKDPKAADPKTGKQGDLGTGTFDPNAKPAESIKVNINGKDYIIYRHTDGYYYIPGEKVPRTPDGWSRMNVDPKLDAAREKADKLPPPFPKGYTGKTPPASAEQSGKFAPSSSSVPPEGADTATVTTWLTQNVPNAKSGDKYWVDGKRYEFVVKTSRGGTRTTWEENKPWTIDNSDPDYRRESSRYTGPQGGPKDMVASTWEKNAYAKRQQQPEQSPEQSGKREPIALDVRIRNLERQIAGLQPGTFKDGQIAKLAQLKAERDGTQQSGKKTNESTGYSEDQTLASIVHLAGLR